MKAKRTIATAFFVLTLVSLLAGQVARQTGVIRGVISDSEGTPLPGATVTATSQNLIGNVSDITSADGSFRCPALPPGDYTIVAVLSGFKSAKQENISVRVGMIVTINLRLEVSALKEEVTVTAVSPTVDVQSLKVSTRLDASALERIPLNRRLGNIIALTPGLISSPNEKMIGMDTGTMHGGTGYSTAFEVDGVSVSDPAHNGSMIFAPQYDSIEEVAVETGGLSADVGNTSGNFVNVVTKSGGNDFHGTANGFYGQEKLLTVFATDEQLKALGLGKPSIPIYSLDVSGSLGGPIVRDKLWFFATIANERNRTRSPFIPTTILGVKYDQYELPESYLDGFLKLTTQLSSKLRLFVMGGYSHQMLPYTFANAYRPQPTTLSKDNDDRMTATGNLSWQASSSTIVDFRGGITHFAYPILLPEPFQESMVGPSFQDLYTGYYWGAYHDFPQRIDRLNRQASIRLTHFQDNFLGVDHEFQAGIEYRYGRDRLDWWRKNTMNWYWYNGSPYYYRGLYGLTGPHATYGDGRLRFQITGPDEGKSVTSCISGGFGIYISDAFTIKNRVTVTLGVRYDNARGWVPPAFKEAGFPLAVSVGEYAIRPTYGFNPYGAMTTPAWDPAMKWTSFSPRVGISWDIFGNGKTALKISFAQYREPMPVMFFQQAQPLTQGQSGTQALDFYWWDDNNNGQPDLAPIDRYVLFAGNASQFDPNPAVYEPKIPKDSRSPKYDEIIFGIDHQLFPEFRLGAKYYYRNKADAIDNTLYDRNTKRYWYTYEQAPDWWVPFTTIVPGYGAFSDHQVTMYFLAKNAPWEDRFSPQNNVSESRRRYQALEITFDKRYSHGWSLGGSVVVSKLMANLSSGDSTGARVSFDNANWLVNRLGRTDDRPLMIKLYAAADIPFGFVCSFYAYHFSGIPFTRTVTVYPPAAWATANNARADAFSINVEQQGSHSSQDVDNVNARFEKDFAIGRFGRLTMAVDITNLLGNAYFTFVTDPGGTWRPSDANTKVGTYTPASNFGRPTAFSGSRIYKFNLRLTF